MAEDRFPRGPVLSAAVLPVPPELATGPRQRPWCGFSMVVAAPRHVALLIAAWGGGDGSCTHVRFGPPVAFVPALSNRPGPSAILLLGPLALLLHVQASSAPSLPLRFHCRGCLARMLASHLGPKHGPSLLRPAIELLWDEHLSEGGQRVGGKGPESALEKLWPSNF